MTNINLLPWREEAREKQKSDYIKVLIFVVIGAVLIGFLAVGVVNMMIDNQHARNNYLRSEIHKLDKQIARISIIRKRKRDIEHRANIILGLQYARNLPTHVLDELVRIVPGGVYFSSLEKKGNQVEIEGSSESNNNVANMMRKVKDSSWLHNPTIKSIVAQDKKMRKQQRFNLRVTVADRSSASDKLAVRPLIVDIFKATQGANQ